MRKARCVLNLLRFIARRGAVLARASSSTRSATVGREVITADLERAIEEATGRSMARFFEQWVYKAGHPEFKVSYSWDDEQQLAKLTVKQTQESTT